MNQNKTTRAFSLIFALALVFAAATLFSPVAAADAYENLLVLGDSISTGYGLDNPGIDSYGAKLAEAMGLPKQGYLNLAKDGANSTDLINLLKMPETAEIISEHSLIVISIGGNDLLGPFFALAKQALGLEADAPSEALLGAFEKNQNAMLTIAAAMLENQASFVAIAGDFAQNLAEIIDLIKAANPGAQILVQTIYDPFDGVPGFEMLSMASGLLISQMNQAILGGAAEAGYITLDIAAAFEGAALLYTNIAAFDIHPNAAGHNLIFEQIYAAICAPGDWCDENAAALYYAGLLGSKSPIRAITETIPAWMPAYAGGAPYYIGIGLD